MKQFAIATLEQGLGRVRARIMAGGCEGDCWAVHPVTDDLAPGNLVLVSFYPEDQFCKVVGLDEIEERK